MVSMPRNSFFGGFVEFQFLVFAKRPILLKKGDGGAFQFYAQILTKNLLQR